MWVAIAAQGQTDQRVAANVHQTAYPTVTETFTHSSLYPGGQRKLQALLRFPVEFHMWGLVVIGHEAAGP